MDETIFNQSSPDASKSPLTLNAESETLIAKAARWSRFLGIFSFVMCGLLLLCGLGVMVLENIDFISRDGVTTCIFLGLYFLGIFFPGLLLFRFANYMRIALASRDEATLTKGFRQLAKLFAFLGIFCIVAIALVVVASLL